MPVVEFVEQSSGKTYAYEVSQYACQRVGRDLVYASNLFETLRAEEQERLDAELAKKLADPQPQSQIMNDQTDESLQAQCSQVTPNPENESIDSPASQALSRWTKEQTLFLIETLPTLFAEYERSSKKKHQAYEKTAKLLRMKGHNFVVDQVKNKWLLLQRLYKSNLDLKKTSGAGKITWEYFQLMDDKLGKRRENDPLSTFSSTGTETTSPNKAVGTEKTGDNSSEAEGYSQKPNKRKSSSTLLEYLEAKKTETKQKEEAKLKRHEEKMAVKQAGIKILSDILNELK